VAFCSQAKYMGRATAVAGNVSADFCGYRLLRGKRGGTATAFNTGLLDRSQYFLFQVAPRSRLTIYQKS
jgi:hypothetical protein